LIHATVLRLIFEKQNMKIIRGFSTCPEGMEASLHGYQSQSGGAVRQKPIGKL
jgi:hypothetical protein